MTKKELSDLLDDDGEIAPVNEEDNAEYYALQESGYTDTDYYPEWES